MKLTTNNFSRYSEIGFDLDGTIYDIFEWEIPVMENIIKSINKVKKIPREKFIKRYLELMKGNCEARYDKIAMEFELDLNLRDKMIYIHRNATPKIKPRGTLSNLIFQLHEEGKKLFLVTNGSKIRQESKIKDLNLENVFTLKFFAGDYPFFFRKPSTCIFKTAAKQKGLELNQSTVYIGDSSEDRQFAHNLSINFLHFCNRSGVSKYRKRNLFCT
jgi:FMN phosphatase YigB (HAD superfamily)